MKKTTTLKSVGALCIIYMILSALLPDLFQIYLSLITSTLCLLLLVLSRLNWRKKFEEHWNLKNHPKRIIFSNKRLDWRTGLEEIDELYISGYYWAIASLVVPMFDIPFWKSFFNNAFL